MPQLLNAGGCPFAFLVQLATFCVKFHMSCIGRIDGRDDPVASFECLSCLTGLPVGGAHCWFFFLTPSLYAQIPLGVIGIDYNCHRMRAIRSREAATVGAHAEPQGAMAIVIRMVRWQVHTILMASQAMAHAMHLRQRPWESGNGIFAVAATPTPSPSLFAMVNRGIIVSCQTSSGSCATFDDLDIVRGDRCPFDGQCVLCGGLRIRCSFELTAAGFLTIQR